MSEVKVINGSVEIVSSTNQARLDESRGQLVAGFKKTGEVITHYAKTCTKVFGAEWWNAKGETGKAVKAERDKFFSMGEAQLGWTKNNCYQQWLRVQLAAGRPEKTKAPQLQGGNDIDGKTISELKTILNRIGNTEREKAPLSFKVVNLLLEVADQMGIDTKEFGLNSDSE